MPSMLFGASRIFYEDNEASDFSDSFLEKYYGTSYSSYWSELTSEITRSSDNPRGGVYCMTYDPWQTDNPHAIVGYSGASYGNTSGLSLHSFTGRYWYFRWYQRWEENIDYSGSIENKLLYINFNGRGDFVFTVKKRGSCNLHITIKDRDTYGLVHNVWFSNTDQISLDDTKWHKFELFIDVGTTGSGNGSYWLKVDGNSISNASNITYNGTIHSNPIEFLTGWPSNAPRVSQPSGTGRTWLDDLEIYILNGPNDIPSEIGNHAPTSPGIVADFKHE